MRLEFTLANWKLKIHLSPKYYHLFSIIYHLTIANRCSIIYLSLLFRVVWFTKGMDVLDYKRKIIEMLDMLDDRRLRLIYVHIKAILGLK